MINLRNTKGFTLTEVMFVMVVSVLVIGVIVSAWVFTYRTWTAEGRKTMLRVNILKAMETIQTDLRLSSATYMAFYPSSSTTGEYTAVSMPLAEIDSNGFYEIDDSQIEWDKTVIYHLYREADGTRTLRRTVIDPRDNSLDYADLSDQVADVVSSGTGGSGSTTDTKFLKNVDHFAVATRPAVVDFYEDSVDPVRVGKVTFGWARLESGDHTIKFEVTDKDEDSSGYAFALDYIDIEPSGSKREAEYYNSSFAPSGSVSSNGMAITRVYDPTWNNRNYLEYGATGVGDYIEFTDQYDLWRESAFDNSSRDNTMLWGEEVRAKLELPRDRSSGNEDITWYAHQETSDSQQDGRDVDFPAYPITFRTVVTNPNIDTEGDLVRVQFKSSSDNPLKISAAYITRRNSGSGGYANAASSSSGPVAYHRHQQLFFEDTYDMDGDGSTTDIVPYVFIPPDSQAWSVWVGFPFKLQDLSSNDLSYFITFSVPDLDNVTFPSGWTDFSTSGHDGKYWQGSSSGGTVRTYYITSGSYSTVLLPAAGTPVWSGTYTVQTSSDVYVSAEIDTWKKTGTVESDIYDTGIDDPAYSQMKWSEECPTGTEVTLKTRSSDSEFMTGATDWSGISGSTVNPHSLSVGSGRYVQWQATLTTEPFWVAGAQTEDYDDYVNEQRTLAVYQFPSRSGEYMVAGEYSTWIDDVQVGWPGDSRICLIEGFVTRKNDYGKVKVTIDGQDIIKNLGVDIRVAETFNDKEIAEDLSVDVDPRNTGK